MKKIQDYVERIQEEIDDAREYAEKYHANHRNERYRQMAEDELKHADYLHEMAVADIEKLKEEYTPPADMQKTWDLSHREYIEQAAWVRQMLAL